MFPFLSELLVYNIVKMNAHVSISIADSIEMWAARLTRIAVLLCVMSSPRNDRVFVLNFQRQCIYAALQYNCDFLG